MDIVWHIATSELPSLISQLEEVQVMEGFCEPIYTREEMAELRQIATEIEGEPPRTKNGDIDIAVTLASLGQLQEVYADLDELSEEAAADVHRPPRDSTRDPRGPRLRQFVDRTLN